MTGRMMGWLRNLFTKRSAPGPEPYVWWVRRDLETVVRKAMWRDAMRTADARLREHLLAMNAPPATRAELDRFWEQRLPRFEPVRWPLVPDQE